MCARCADDVPFVLCARKMCARYADDVPGRPLRAQDVRAQSGRCERKMRALLG
jgi:hypothetical protein